MYPANTRKIARRYALPIGLLLLLSQTLSPFTLRHRRSLLDPLLQQLSAVHRKNPQSKSAM